MRYTSGMNIQHSARNEDWRTPAHILELVREVLGTISLDPASSEAGNEEVQASTYFTRHSNGLEQTWYGSVYCNPPGGKLRNQSLAALFWRKLMEQRPNLTHAIFAAFSVEQLATCQGGPGESMLDFPICVPRRRVRWVDPMGAGRVSPSHSNVFVYVPGVVDATERFIQVFGPMGVVKA